MNFPKVLQQIFPGCLVLLDDVHVERYFREKVFPGGFTTIHLVHI